MTYRTPRATTSVLFLTGDGPTNSVGSASASYTDLADTVPSGTVPWSVLASPFGNYVPPDVAEAVLNAYDELVVDVTPVVSPDGSVGVQSPTVLDVFRRLALVDSDFWLLVRTDGYGVVVNGATGLGSTMAARSFGVAVNVANWLGGQVLSRLLNRNRRFRGFAFLCPDLNVRFPDSSVIDRLMQNRCVQLAWNLGGGALILTSRPGDHTCLQAPVFGTDDAHLNTNSGLLLPYPILGTNPGLQDGLGIVYPASVPYALSAAVFQTLLMGSVPVSQDPGFPLNVATYFLAPLDGASVVSDGSGGTSSAPLSLQRALAFAAACGITRLGTSGSSTVVSPDDILPLDANVNTTGTCRLTSLQGSTRVTYANPTVGVDTVRHFDAALYETATT